MNTLILTGTWCSNDFASAPSYALIKIRQEGVAQLAELYRAVRSLQGIGVETVKATPSSGLSVTWLSAVSEQTLKSAETHESAGDDVQLFVDDEDECWDERTECLAVRVDSHRFWFHCLSRESDNTIESKAVHWDELPGLKEAVERQLASPSSNLPEFGWRLSPSSLRFPAIPVSPDAKPGRAVFVLLLEHASGRGMTAYQTRRQAEAALAEIAREQWLYRADKDAPDDPSVLGDDKVINAFYEGNSADSYKIVELAVEPVEAAKPVSPRVLVFIEKGVSDYVADGDVHVEVFDKDNFDAGDDWEIPAGFEDLAPAWLKALLGQGMAGKHPIGTRILSVHGEMAWVGEEGELETGPKAVGIVKQVLPEQEHCYSVVFDNGVWVFLSDEELADASCYRVLPGGRLRQAGDGLAECPCCGRQFDTDKDPDGLDVGSQCPADDCPSNTGHTDGE